MRRREFMAGLGGALAWTVAARAQQPSMPVVGLVSGRSAQDASRYTAALRKGLDESGYVEGQNVMVEYHWTANTIACRRSLPTWYVVAWPLLPAPAATLLPLRLKLRPRRSRSSSPLAKIPSSSA